MRRQQQRWYDVLALVAVLSVMCGVYGYLQLGSVAWGLVSAALAVPSALTGLLIYRRFFTNGQ